MSPFQATYRDLLHLGGSDCLHCGWGEGLQRAIGCLCQHPLGLYRLHLLLDGNGLHLRGCHQALHLRLQDFGEEEKKVTWLRDAVSPQLQRDLRMECLLMTSASHLLLKKMCTAIYKLV